MKTVIRICLSFLPITAVILVVFQVYMTNRLVAAGKELRSVESAISQAREENERLVTEVASASSLLTLRQKAAEYGFVEPSRDKILTFPETLPVAFQPQP